MAEQRSVGGSGGDIGGAGPAGQCVAQGTGIGGGQGRRPTGCQAVLTAASTGNPGSGGTDQRQDSTSPYQSSSLTASALPPLSGVRPRASGGSAVPAHATVAPPPRDTSSANRRANSRLSPRRPNLRPDDVQPGYALRPGEWQPTPEPPPEKKRDDKDGRRRQVGQASQAEALAEKRGEDWALRNAARGSVGLTRPIRVECYADRLVVVSDRGPAGNKVIPLGPRTASSINPLISAVWEQMEAWGMAGRGMYWRPVLQVCVAPGAEQRRFADLSSLLEGSGLTVERKR